MEGKYDNLFPMLNQKVNRNIKVLRKFKFT